jgi:hypothetical protein
METEEKGCHHATAIARFMLPNKSHFHSVFRRGALTKIAK